MVMCLIDLLKDRYGIIAVVSRGYKRKSTGILVVSNGNGDILDCGRGGDEPVLIARKYPQCPVVVAENAAGVLRRH